VVAQRAQGGLRDAESLLDQLSLLPPPVEPQAVWELLGAVPEQELLHLAESLAAGEPLGLIEAIRTLLERGREPSAVLQGLAGLLRDLVLAGVAPDRLELTSFSPQFRTALPELARRIGKAPLLRWQAQLKGSEQQLRQSVQPRLWLEVLLLGLLAEPQARATAPASIAAAVVSAAPPTAVTPLTAPPVAEETAPAAPVPSPAPAQPEQLPELEPEPAVAAATANPAGPDLTELWQQILAGLELPSTRMLLSQQAVLARLDQQRAVIQVAGNWMAMVQSRLPLLEKAVSAALGSPRQVMLEAGGAPPPVSASPERPAPIPSAAAPMAGMPAAPSPASQATAAAPAAAAPPPAQAPPAEPAKPEDSPAAAVATIKPAMQPPAQPALIDDQAKRLAEFFNGEVVQLDGPLPELDPQESGDQAA
jgi:DNA polymerase-3 subunit gamma/tau